MWFHGARRAVGTAREGSGSLTQAWTTDVPGLSVMQGTNREADVSASMTVHGARIGRAAFRERGQIWVGAGSVTNNKTHSSGVRDLDERGRTSTTLITQALEVPADVWWTQS